MFAGDKRVYMAEQFYDITRPVIRKYHQLFIRQSVNTFHDNNGVIHSIGMEYTGPLHFMKFWLEEIASCPNHQLVALTATKDVQDAVLQDSLYNKMVDIIDIRQWHYRNDGSLYEPQGGCSLAPRQWARLIDPGTTSCESIYRAVYEYRSRYPEKAVTYNAAMPRNIEGNAANWAIFMAGGSLAKVPPIEAMDVYTLASEFQPITSLTESNRQWVMGKAQKGYLVYCLETDIHLDLSHDRKTYKVVWINPVNGEIFRKEQTRLKGGKVISLKAPQKYCVCLLY